MKGRVIGKGGATIKAIQASSGANVSLVDCTAVVYGQPGQVREAVRQVEEKCVEEVNPMQRGRRR